MRSNELLLKSTATANIYYASGKVQIVYETDTHYTSNTIPERCMNNLEDTKTMKIIPNDHPITPFVPTVFTAHGDILK